MVRNRWKSFVYKLNLRPLSLNKIYGLPNEVSLVFR